MMKLLEEEEYTGTKELIRTGCYKEIIIQNTSTRKQMEKRKNIIFNLEKDGGKIEKDEDIINHATEYYKEPFGPSDSLMFSLDPECWDQEEKITEEENVALT
jgi:hypothetical protein